MGDWKQNTAIVVTTAVVVAATVFTGGLAAGLVGGAIGAGAVATGVGLATAFLVGNVLSYIGGSIIQQKPLDPKEFACGNKEANAIECVSYQGGQLLTGAIVTKAVGLVSKNFKPGTTNKVSGVTQGIDDLKKVGNYVDDVDDVKVNKGNTGTSTKVNIDGSEYLFDGEFYYKDGKTFLRVLDPDGSLSAAKGKMVEVNDYYSQKIAQHSYEKHVVKNGEFPDIKSQAQFKNLIQNILDGDYTKSKNLSGGRVAYFREVDNTLLIYDPSSPDLGTCFRPKNPTTGLPDGLSYFNNVLK